MRTIPYNAMIETLDSTIANALDKLEEERDTALELDVITDDEAEKVQDFIDSLEVIRGTINN